MGDGGRMSLGFVGRNRGVAAGDDAADRGKGGDEGDDDDADVDAKRLDGVCVDGALEMGVRAGMGVGPSAEAAARRGDGVRGGVGAGVIASSVSGSLRLAVG